MRNEKKKNHTHSKNTKKNNSCVLIQKTGCTYNIRAWDMSYVLCRKREVTWKKSLRFIAKTCIILYSKLFLTMIFIYFFYIYNMLLLSTPIFCMTKYVTMCHTNITFSLQFLFTSIYLITFTCILPNKVEFIIKF